MNPSWHYFGHLHNLNQSGGQLELLAYNIFDFATPARPSRLLAIPLDTQQPNSQPEYFLRFLD